MIFVTVGMHTQSFDRLVRAADELSALVDEDVIIQRGASTYLPRFAQHVDYVDGARMQEWLTECRVVVSHAGAGSILGVLRVGKPLVLAPRMQRFDEHFDDHQFELAEALAERNRVVMVTALSAENLVEATERATQLKREDLGETGLHTALRDWLARQGAHPASRWWRSFWSGGGG